MNIQLTQDEFELEFQIVRLPNIDCETGSDTRFFDYVARQCGPSCYVIRRLIGGLNVYQRLSYGILDGIPGCAIKWFAMGSIHQHADQAIHASEVDLDSHQEFSVSVSPIPQEAP